jgi:hypothetical protein
MEDLAMDRQSVEKCVIEAVEEVQSLAGCPPLTVTPRTRPMDELPDFDSMRGVETAVVLGGKLGREIGSGNEDVNLFGKDGQARTIAEVADRVLELIS